jgi:hypothetical protein
LNIVRWPTTTPRWASTWAKAEVLRDDHPQDHQPVPGGPAHGQRGRLPDPCLEGTHAARGGPAGGRTSPVGVVDP